MPRVTHDELYLGMLTLVAGRATCPRRSVGAIIVDAGNHVLSTGFNGVPKGFTHCIDVPCPGARDQHGDTRRCQAVHAEVNAVLQCTRLDSAATMYISCVPCFECAKVICNTNITRVVCLEDYPGAGREMLAYAKIKVEIATQRRFREIEITTHDDSVRRFIIDPKREPL